jgi:hypothetical protein
MRGGQRARISARHPTRRVAVSEIHNDRARGFGQDLQRGPIGRPAPALVYWQHEDQSSVDVGEVAMQHPSRRKVKGRRHHTTGAKQGEEDQWSDGHFGFALAGASAGDRTCV